MKAERDQAIRVLVVESSPAARDLLVDLVNQSGDMVVVATAQDGEEAVHRALRLRPDVVAMGALLPGMDGLEATRRIMRASPTRVVLITSGARPDADVPQDALKAGAVAVARIPGDHDPEGCASLLQTLRLMAGVSVVTRWRTAQLRPPQATVPQSFTPRTAWTGGAALRNEDCQGRRVIAIASSTGGPAVLAAVLKRLPADFPLPILIVQHITRGFGTSLAGWLASQAQIRVKTAAHREALSPGVALLAPDDYHLSVSRFGIVALSQEEPFKGLRPSANLLFESLAVQYGHAAVGVILTGMGDDGADGMAAMRQAGGLTLAQNEASCAVYGMPREAVLRNAVQYVFTPEQIAAALLQLSAQPGG